MKRFSFPSDLQNWWLGQTGSPKQQTMEGLLFQPPWHYHLQRPHDLASPVILRAEQILEFHGLSFHPAFRYPN